MRTLITTVAAILILTAAAYAADEPKPAADAGKGKATAQPAPGAAAEAAKFLDEAIARYRKLKTYQDEAELGFEMIAQDKSGGDAGRKQTFASKLKFRSPNLIVVEGEDQIVQSDGRKLWQVRPEWKQYIEQEAPKNLDPEELLGRGGMPFGGHPILRLLATASNKPGDCFPELTELKEVRAESRAGRPGHVLVCAIEMSFDDLGSRTGLLWFDDADGLLRDIRVDLTEPYRKRYTENADEGDDEEDSGRPAKVERVELYVRLDKVQVDADLPVEAFTLKPAEDFKKVEDFDESDRPSPEDLIDKPAPAFSGDDLTGEKLSLESLKGRVVVLDFWATWCGPCVAAIPHVQKIADKFKDEPVTIIGMNRDGKGTDSKVKKFLEKKKITLRQFMDVDGKIARSYNVSGIPSLFIIDKEGVIRDAHVGFSGESMADDIAEKIAKLLKGEKIDRDAPSKRTAEEEEEAEENGEGQEKGAAALENIAAERLVAGKRLRYTVSSDFRPFDVDGDGQDEWVATDTEGHVLVMSAGGANVKTISVGKSRDGYVSDFQPVRMGGKVCWLIAQSRAESRGSRPARLMLCDIEGEPLWSTDIESPAKTHSQLKLAAGDLLGDGKPMFAALMTTYAMGGSAKQQNYLHLFDSDGKLIVRSKITADWIGNLTIIPGAAGQPGRLLISANGRLRSFTLGPAGVTDPNNPPVRPAVEEKAKQADEES